MFDLISMIRSTLRKLPWLSFAEQRLHYTCLHTFVTAGRISFNVDIFPLVIVFVFHLNSIFNFCLAHFREISDLITAACIPTQSTVKQFILVYKLYCWEQRRKLTTFSRVIQTDLFQVKPNISFCLIVKKHYTIYNEKKRNKFSFLRAAKFGETKF